MSKVARYVAFAIAAATLHAGCHTSTWTAEVDTSRGWGPDDGGQIWYPEGRTVYVEGPDGRDGQVPTLGFEGNIRLLHVGADDGETRLVVADEAHVTAYAAGTVYDTVDELGVRARLARWANNQIYALVGEGPCAVISRETTLTIVPCVEDAGFAVNPSGDAAFATGDSVALISDGELVVVDIAGDQVASDGVSDAFFVADTLEGRVYAVAPEGTILWDNVVAGTLAGFAASPLGVAVMTETWEADSHGVLTVWDSEGAPAFEVEFPSAATVRMSPGGTWFAFDTGDEVHLMNAADLAEP